jgi:hypothetical protein
MKITFAAIPLPFYTLYIILVPMELAPPTIFPAASRR